MRAGIGFDIHRFGEGDEVILWNVRIPYNRKLTGHSDADVLLHAICDAMLGAAGQGDIGIQFPNTDVSLKGISSLELLKRTKNIIRQKGFSVSNLDSVVIAEAPKILPYRDAMINNIAGALEIDVSQVNVKATTSEGIGAIGNGEGFKCSFRERSCCIRENRGISYMPWFSCSYVSQDGTLVMEKRCPSFTKDYIALKQISDRQRNTSGCKDWFIFFY